MTDAGGKVVADAAPGDDPHGAEKDVRASPEQDVRPRGTLQTKRRTMSRQSISKTDGERLAVAEPSLAADVVPIALPAFAPLLISGLLARTLSGLARGEPRTLGA